MSATHGMAARASPFDLQSSQPPPGPFFSADLLLGLQAGLPAVSTLPSGSGLLPSVDGLGGSSLAASTALSSTGLLDPLQRQLAALQAQQLAAQAAAAEQLLPLLNLSNLLAFQGLSATEVADLLALKQALQQSGSRPSGSGHGTGPLANPLYKVCACAEAASCAVDSSN